MIKDCIIADGGKKNRANITRRKIDRSPKVSVWTVLKKALAHPHKGLHGRWEIRAWFFLWQTLGDSLFRVFRLGVIDKLLCGHRQRVNGSDIGFKKPKQNGTFDLSFRHCLHIENYRLLGVLRFNQEFCDLIPIDAIAHQFRRFALLWDAHRLRLFAAMFLACGPNCSLGDITNSDQLGFNVFGGEFVTAGNKFRKLEHVNNVSVQRFYQLSLMSEFPAQFRKFDVLFPVSNCRLNCDFSQVASIIKAAIDNSQDPRGKPGDNETRESNQSADDLRVREYSLHM